MSASADQDTTYNGWKNRETWVVDLWLGNDPGYYRDCKVVVESLIKDIDLGALSIWQAKLDLEDTLQEYVENVCPARQGGLEGDLLKTALSRVDWEEIAQGLLEAEEVDFDPEVTSLVSDAAQAVEEIDADELERYAAGSAAYDRNLDHIYPCEYRSCEEDSIKGSIFCAEHRGPPVHQCRADQ